MEKKYTLKDIIFVVIIMILLFVIGICVYMIASSTRELEKQNNAEIKTETDNETGNETGNEVEENTTLEDENNIKEGTNINVNNVPEEYKAFSNRIIKDINKEIVIYELNSEKMYLTTDEYDNLILKDSRGKIEKIDFNIGKIYTMGSFGGCGIGSRVILIINQEKELFVYKESLIGSSEIKNHINQTIYKIESEYKVTNLTTLIEGYGTCGTFGNYVVLENSEIRKIDYQTKSLSDRIDVNNSINQNDDSCYNKIYHQANC